jgi:hypothetical protein
MKVFIVVIVRRRGPIGNSGTTEAGQPGPELGDFHFSLGRSLFGGIGGLGALAAVRESLALLEVCSLFSNRER